MSKRHWLCVVQQIAAIGFAFAASAVMAQSWKPERNVELIVPAEAGGSLDITGRTLQKIWDDLKLLPVSSTIVNRGGGAHAIAYAFLTQHAGDAHYLSITSANLLSGHINGRLPSTYTDFSVIATLLSENIAFAVRPDSPLKTGRDFIDALKKNPATLSIALGSAVGGTHHVTVGLPLQSGGVDVKQVKFVGFNSSSSAVTAILGGHVDVVVAGTLNVSQQIEAGKLRAIAVSAPKRMTGVMASAPTWPEQGLKGVMENWRGIMGPPKMSAQALEFWEGIVKQTVNSDEFKAYATKNQWDIVYRNAKEARAFMEQDYNQLKSVMGFLGLAKPAEK